MTGPAPLIDRLRPHLDRDAANALLARAVQAASVTGDAARMVAMLVPEMDRLGLSPKVEEFLPGRANVTSRRAGAGPDLLFIGHTDVVHPKDWADHWQGQPQQDPFGAAVLDGNLWGRGSADLKAGICTALAVLDLLDRAGVRLAGSVSFAFVGDEESGEPFIAIFGGGSLLGIPSLVIWTIAVVIVGHLVFRETRFGAHVLAVGDNPRAALVSGIRVARLRLSVLVLSGACAGLAGLLYAGRLQAARYTLGESDLMTVIAAVIVGGTALNGGRGSIPGALVGSLMMGMLSNGLILMGLSVSWQMIIKGLIVLAAVAVSLREPNR